MASAKSMLARKSPSSRSSSLEEGREKLALYQRERRLRLNPDTRSRINVKVKRYLTEAQARKVERTVDELIGIEPRVF